VSISSLQPDVAEQLIPEAQVDLLTEEVNAAASRIPALGNLTAIGRRRGIANDVPGEKTLDIREKVA
jgi:hypothetical protein